MQLGQQVEARVEILEARPQTVEAFPIALDLEIHAGVERVLEAEDIVLCALRGEELGDAVADRQLLESLCLVEASRRRALQPSAYFATLSDSA